MPNMLTKVMSDQIRFSTPTKQKIHTMPTMPTMHIQPTMPNHVEYTKPSQTMPYSSVWTSVCGASTSEQKGEQDVEQLEI